MNGRIPKPPYDLLLLTNSSDMPHEALKFGEVATALKQAYEDYPHTLHVQCDPVPAFRVIEGKSGFTSTIRNSMRTPRILGLVPLCRIAFSESERPNEGSIYFLGRVGANLYGLNPIVDQLNGVARKLKRPDLAIFYPACLRN